MTTYDDTVIYVLNCINRFKSFYGLDNLPSIEIQSFYTPYDHSHSLDYGVLATHFYDTEKKRHTLKVWNKLPSLGTKAEPVVFHELTHVLDTEKYSTSKTHNVAIKGYIEYHASQIEMLRVLGWESVNSEKRFSLLQKNDMLLYGDTLYDYVIAQKTTAEKLISRKGFPQNSEVLHTALSIIFNYIGRLSISKMYSTDYAENQTVLENSSIISAFLKDSVYNSLLELLLKWPSEREISVLSVGYLNMIVCMHNKYKL